MSLESALMRRIADDVKVLVESGTDVVLAFSTAARIIVAEAADLGEDLATTGLAAVHGAIYAASTLAVSAEDAASAAATGAIDAAGNVSTAAAARVRDAITGTVAGVRVIAHKTLD